MHRCANVGTVRSVISIDVAICYVAEGGKMNAAATPQHLAQGTQ